MVNFVVQPMKVIVNSSVSRKPVTVRDVSELDSAIRNAFKVDEDYRLFRDPEWTVPLDPNTLEEGDTIYMQHQLKEQREYKEEMKCSHSPEAVCPKCATLDPLDRMRPSGSPDSQPIKVRYMSYDSYKVMLRDRGAKEPEYDYRLRICDDHPKKVRCTKCMERVITLVPQLYRPIDYVEFDNKGCVDEFIRKWKSSTKQQVALLIGRVLPCSHLPLAKKVSVCGMWEIEQEKFPDRVALQCMPERFISDDLRIVGVIYSDLFMRDSALYSYKRARNYIISAAELNFIYEVQSQVKTKEFVAICVTPNEKREIVLECFMLSDQFVALMDADVLELTTEPAFFTTEREIKYIEKNEYNRAVQKDAGKRVPVDYFVVKCESGYIDSPLFPNNEFIEKPSIYRLAVYFNNDFGFEKFNSFPILMAVSKHYSETGRILSAVLKGDREEFAALTKTEGFAKFKRSVCKMYESAWTCPRCKSINSKNSEKCDGCGEAKQ